MSLETMEFDTVKDTFVREDFPTSSYAAATHLEWGVLATKIRNTFIRFTLPKFSGEIKSIKLKIDISTIPASPTLMTTSVHLMKSPYDVLWTGLTVGAIPTNEYCTWNEYDTYFNWPTAGGDYVTDPITTFTIKSTDLVGWYEFEIPVGLLSLQSEQTICLFLRSPDTSINYELKASSLQNGVYGPKLLLEVEIDGFEALTLTAEPISSTQLDISWPKSQLSDDNFTHYLLEQSDTGVGGWTTLATITDKDTTSYEHTGLVVQGDVDDYDEDSDTYPNGRKKYYRMSVVSSVFGATGYGTADATTIPAIRPVSLTFNPKSKYWDMDFIDDNRAYKPYGVEVIPSWYDSLDITEENYIDKLTVEAYFRIVSAWVLTETNNFSPVDFDTGGIIVGDEGYKPYEVKGKIYDTGGLYRIATTDKTTEQFEIVWPAPCPIAIPSAPNLLNPPRLLAGTPPFAGGTITPIDLSFACQQTGNSVFNEDFVGTLTDKWFTSISGLATIQYVGSDHIEISRTGAVSTLAGIFKKFKKEIDNSYNKYFDKYTGGYKIKLVGQVNINDDVNTHYLRIGTSGWDEQVDNISSGVNVEFRSNISSVNVYAAANIGTPSSRLLFTSTIADANNIMKAVNDGKYFYMEIIASPVFSDVSGGMIYFIMWNIGNTINDAKNIDLLTLSSERFMYMYDVSMPSDEQKHYTGRSSVQYYTTSGSSPLGNINIYEYELEGRIVSQEYGVKNLNLDIVLPSVSSPIPQAILSCSPELSSELVLVEGRIKNNFGSQSRTGETDNYQGETYDNADPIGFLSVPKVGYVGEDALIDASQSIDPEGGALIYKYDFGDTETLETSQSSVSHQYASAGTYTVKLIVEDETGNNSVEVQSIIKIYDAIEQFEEVSLMSPWESINEGSPSGTSITSHPELDYDTIQTMDGGNRVFSLTGQHHDPNCNTPLADRITNAENEKDYFRMLNNQAKLITLDLVNFGKVRGVITDHKPSMAVDDQQAFQFSMTFQEIDIRQFGD